MGIILLIIVTAVAVVCCILAKALNAFLQPLATKQMISLRTERQKRNKENDRLKDREPNAVTCEDHTEIQQKNGKNAKAIAGSSANDLNFDHFS